MLAKLKMCVTRRRMPDGCGMEERHEQPSLSSVGVVNKTRVTATWIGDREEGDHIIIILICETRPDFGGL